jgi:haloacetate dehalogenase
MSADPEIAAASGPVAAVDYGRCRIGDADYLFVRAGGGEPVLLLHGFPETHYCWRALIPILAHSHTVIAPDLRGYGESRAPAGGPQGEGFSKREMARELVELMRLLGFDRFAVVGHDRGARVAYRMAFDFPDTVERLAVLNVIPTADQFERNGRRPVARLLAVVPAGPAGAVPGAADRGRAGAVPALHLRHVDGRRERD